MAAGEIGFNGNFVKMLRRTVLIYLCAIAYLWFSSPLMAGGWWYGKDSDTSVNRKMMRIQKVIPLEYTDGVRESIRRKTYEDRLPTQEAFYKAYDFIPSLEKKLLASSLPAELKYLPVALSGMDPTYESVSGGAGIWKIPYLTGIRTGLSIDNEVDERRDPVKSTDAAISYLSLLKSLYKDWKFTLLAYITSPSEVNSARMRSGNPDDFKQVFYLVSDEAKQLFNDYIATVYLMHYAADYYFDLKSLTAVPETRKYTVQEDIYVEDVAAALGISKRQVAVLNPVFYRGKIPGKRSFSIVIPVNLAGAFEKSEAQLYVQGRFRQQQNPEFKLVTHVHQDEDLATGSDIEGSDEEGGDGENTSGGSTPENTPTAVATKKVSHTIQPGETLFRISQNYGVTIDQIREWNGIKGDGVYAGQTLLLYVPDNNPSMPDKSQNNTVVSSGGTKSNGSTSSSGKNNTTTSTGKSQSTAKSGTWITYKVRSGDSLWKISQKYPGVTESDLKKNNNLSSNTIYPGQVLKIKKQN